MPPYARPTFAAERELRRSGCRLVAGVDEVGRGAWAGPLTVGIAVLKVAPGEGVPTELDWLRDSKQLTERRREAMFDVLASACVAWSVGDVEAAECDRAGMTAAQIIAARRALDALDVDPDFFLVDGRWAFVGGRRARAIVRGDASCMSIAAAAVLAKVTRDRLMRNLAPSYPAYDFDRNKGYPAPAHRFALAGWGPTPLHRTSWSFMSRLPWGRHVHSNDLLIGPLITGRSA